MKNLISFAIFLLLPALLFAQIKYVPTDYTTIQSAIDAAEDGEIVIVEEGTYYEQINFLGKAITVASRYYLDNDTSYIPRTIIDGIWFSESDSASLVYFVNGEDSTSVLSGFTLQNGRGTWYPANPPDIAGGAIYMEGSGGKIVNNIIKDNILINENMAVTDAGAYGVGIECFFLPLERNLVIEKNQFYNNYGRGNEAMGGGVDVWHTYGTIRISSNRFIGNEVYAKDSGYGGGISIMGTSNNSDVRIENNYISRNSTYSASGWSKGAGISCYFAAPVIRNNIIVYNSTDYSQQNASAAFGGGIAVFWYESRKQSYPLCEPESLIAVIENNTIAYNNDKIAGGGLAFRSVGARLRNNIIGCNFAENNSQIKIEYIEAPETDERTVQVEYCNVEGGFEGEGNINLFPEFADETKWFLKQDNSPCIDAGDPGIQYRDIPDPDNYDKANFPAHGDLRNDMGAFGGPHSKWAEMELLTDVGNEIKELPDNFELAQNYPNPFNPTTTIKFSLPYVGTGHAPSVQLVNLVVYDVLGSEVATLVNTQQRPGNYEVKWDASGKASGVYFYKLTAGNYTDTKKMILLR